MAPYFNDNDESWLDVLARNLPDDPAPTVSIVIPTYNHGDYVAQAIESVIHQSWQDFEIIVVDDGSTDHTRSVVERFGLRVRYIWQKNQGLSAARNTGIRHAEGRYIGLLDADDLYERDYLTTLVEFLEEHAAIGAVYCGYRFVDQDNKALPQIIYQQTDPNNFFETLARGNFLVPESILVRRSCYEEVGNFDESLTACEDWDMWLRISKETHVAGIPCPLTRHRILARSMSSDPARMLDNRLAVLGKHFGPLPHEIHQAPEGQRVAFSRAHLTSVIEYLQAGDRDTAASHFQRMAEVWPMILLDKSIYYELGCGGQQKGYRGDGNTLELDSNAAFVFASLDACRGLLASRNDRGEFWPEVLATAHYGLGILCYNTGRLAAARKHLLKAIQAHWKFSGDRSLIATLTKSLLGPKILAGMRDQF